MKFQVAAELSSRVLQVLPLGQLAKQVERTIIIIHTVNFTAFFMYIPLLHILSFQPKHAIRGECANPGKLLCFNIANLRQIFWHSNRNFWFLALNGIRPRHIPSKGAKVSRFPWWMVNEQGVTGLEIGKFSHSAFVANWACPSRQNVRFFSPWDAKPAFPFDSHKYQL